MSWLSEFMHPGRAYKTASDTLQGGYDQAQGMRQPYMQGGEDAYKKLLEMMNTNPEELQNKWAKGYEESPYAQQLEGAAKARGMDSASQNGLIGSSAALSNLQNTSTNIMQGDRDKYMKDMMEKYMAQMGLGKDVYGIGANMASQGANSQESLASGQAGLGFGGQTAGASMLGQGAGNIMNLIMQYMTGGMGNGGYGRGMWSPTTPNAGGAQ